MLSKGGDGQLLSQDGRTDPKTKEASPSRLLAPRQRGSVTAERPVWEV